MFFNIRNLFKYNYEIENELLMDTFKERGIVKIIQDYRYQLETIDIDRNIKIDMSNIKKERKEIKKFELTIRNSKYIDLNNKRTHN